MTSVGAHINWKDEIGVQFDIPPGAVPEGRELNLEVWPCTNGPFQLPDDYELASPIFLISPSFEFLSNVTLTMSHFSKLETEEDCQRMVFLSAPTTPNVRETDNGYFYQFKPLRKGIFSPHLEYGQVSLTHFCLLASGRKRKSPNSDSLPSNQQEGIYQHKIKLGLHKSHPCTNTKSLLFRTKKGRQ